MFNLKSAAIGAVMCIAAASLTTGSAQATLLSIADSQGLFAGADVVTFDDVTNLEWLDLTESTGRSFNDVSGQFGATGDFEGWRHASSAEVTTLFTNGGFTPPLTSSPATSAMAQLIDQLGRTFGIGDIFGAPPFSIGVFGVFNDFIANGVAPLASLVSVRVPSLFIDVDQALIAPTFQFDAAFATTIGHWIVRDPAPVPEPTALILFGSGVVLLGAVRRRKRGN